MAAAGLALIATTAWAQVDERPSTERPGLPSFPEEPGPRLDLPELPPAPGSAELSAEVRVFVATFDFEGHTAFTTEALRAVLADFTNREIESEELIAARDRITEHYIEAGYVTSGALIPDQPVRDGRLLIRVVEGVLESVEVSGTKRFRKKYFEDRIEVAVGRPVDIHALETVLQRFQRDPLIERVAARLEPSAKLGSSRLALTVVEARQEDVRIGAENDRSPSVGEEAGTAQLSAANLIGFRDELSLDGWFTQGLQDVEARYAVPISRWDTRAEARVRWSESEVVEFPFDDLDIESESLTLSLMLHQPVYRSRSQSLELGIRGDWRQGRSTLDGRLFCFQPGVSDCTPTISVLRGIVDWRWQREDQVAAVRSTISWGGGWLGATTRPGNVPDGRFVSWLLQAQYARRMPLASRLIARFDTQLTDDPLLSFERIAVGGARTVRGYRPNQLVRDNGVIGSLEWRVPLWSRSIGPAYLELAPFWDIGHAWDERFDPGDNTVSSLGLGLLARPFERVEAEVYWGGRLLGVDRVGSGLIGDGIHFRVVIDVW